MRAQRLHNAAACSALILASCLCSGTTTAGEYELRLGVDQQAGYDDNIDFTRVNEIDATSYVLTPNAKLDGKTERWEFGVDLELPFERYSEDRLNSDNQDLQIVSKRQLERGEIDLAGGVLRDSTHRAEEDASGIQTRNAERRVLNTFSGSWVRNLGERDRLSVGGSRQSADYAEVSGLHDYSYGSVLGGWTHIITERMSTQLTVFDSHLESEVFPEVVCVFPISPCPEGLVLGVFPLPDAQTDTAGIQGGFTRIFNERLRADVMLGWRHLKTTNHGVADLNPDLTPVIGTVTDSSNGGLGSLGVTYTGQRFEVAGRLSRDLTPSGIGVLFERDELLVDLAYHLQENLYLRLHAIAYDNQSLDQSVPFERRYYGVMPHVDWRFRRNWKLLGGVEIRSQELVTNSNPAKSNAVFLGLTYASEPLPVFR